MLIAAVPVTAKPSKAAVASVSWRMVDGLMAAFYSSSLNRFRCFVPIPNDSDAKKNECLQ